MSLFSQDKIKDSLGIYFYLIIGGLGSLLMFFLIKQSLPSNQQEVKQYHQDIRLTKQNILYLENQLLQLQYSQQGIHSNFDSLLNTINSNIDTLQKTPKFLTRRQQSILKDKIQAQETLSDSQHKLILKLQHNFDVLNQSCLYIPKLRKALILHPEILGNNALLSSVKELLENSELYCQNKDPELTSIIENTIVLVEELLNREQLAEYKIIITEFVNYGQNLITSQQKIDQIFQEIKSNELQSKIQLIEDYYLEQYQQHLLRVGWYRVLTIIYLFAITVFVAYQIISHLSTTNRNIVKVLEGFTKELETKVEQRTALLEESIQNTEAALSQAQNANKAKSTFLANMSHELRTPLNAILGFTQLMCRDSSLALEHQENLKIINRSGEHLLRLINDILEMSKIEVGRITLNESTFDLYAMLDSLEQMLRLKVQAENLVLIFKISKNVPQLICTDEGKLRQIIINLLGNALKFTEQGSITLTVKIDKTTSQDNQIDFLFSDTYSLCFSVKDTGPGVKPEEMEKLFSPFEQTEIGRISNEGTGLGLSICHKFAELMGGELRVESTVGQGSNFFFNILIRQQDLKTIDSLKSDAVDNRKIIGLASNQPEYRILAVDDVAASRLLLKKLLSGIGYLVQEAGDGLEAIEQWEQWHPDLILMDMRMPVMNGYEATEHIKSQAQDKNTIIIALTASAFEEERVKILSVGCDDFMRKPFQDKELLAKIGQYLKVDYLYEDAADVSPRKQLLLPELTRDNLAVMSLQWRSQLYKAAAKVDNQEIYQLLAEIPEEYESLAQGLENLVEDFRCDKIIDLAKSPN